MRRQLRGVRDDESWDAGALPSRLPTDPTLSIMEKARAILRGPTPY